MAQHLAVALELRADGGEGQLDMGQQAFLKVVTV
jgi:hypothetical protein